MNRYIDDCNSVSELKKVATFLVAIACTRHAIIKGLIKDAAETMTKNLEDYLEGDIGSPKKAAETITKNLEDHLEGGVGS